MLISSAPRGRLSVWYVFNLYQCSSQKYTVKSALMTSTTLPSTPHPTCDEKQDDLSPLDCILLACANLTYTPQFNGAFTTVPAPQLGATAIRAAVSRSTLNPEQITSVYMGNVLSAGSGQAPARQAAIYAGLPTTTEATTVNKGACLRLDASSIDQVLPG
jgi:hypothetical protein